MGSPESAAGPALMARRFCAVYPLAADGGATVERPGPGRMEAPQIPLRDAARAG